MGRFTRTPFEEFVDDVNSRMDPRHPASEDEVLDFWSQGERNPADAVAAIELARLARQPCASLGELVTGTLFVPAGIALVALISLADEADAHTILTATRGDVLLSCSATLVIGLILGLVVGWLTAPRRPSRPPAFADHPDVERLQAERRDRMRRRSPLGQTRP